MFHLKDRNPYPSCVIYKGTCDCGATYIGETRRNTVTRWNEHEDIRKDSEPAKHLTNNINHKFHWTILTRAPIFNRDRKNLEASFITLQKPTLNNQIDTKLLILFRNGIT